MTEPSSIMAMNRDPDFLTRRWIDEQLVSPLAGALLHESGRLQLANDFVPAHLAKSITYR